MNASTVTFSNAWDTLGKSWVVLGIVPGWARGRVFACPQCAAPAIATDVYVGGRGDVPTIECAAGHTVERNGTPAEMILASVKQVLQAQARTPWPTGQNIYVTSELWLTPTEDRLCLCKSQHRPQPVAVLLDSNGDWRWSALPDDDIRQGIAKLKSTR